MKHFQISFVEVFDNDNTISQYSHPTERPDLTRQQSYGTISSNAVTPDIFHKLIKDLVLPKVISVDGNKVTKVNMEMIDGYDCYYSTMGTRVYVCFTKKETPKILPIRLLCDLKSNETDVFDDDKLKFHINETLNLFHEELMAIRNENNGSTSTTEDAEEDLKDIVHIMNDNIDKFLQRQERISLLVDKTSQLNSNSTAFKQRAIKIKRKMWWHNLKGWSCLFFSLIILIFIICFIFYHETTGETPNI